MLMKYRLMKNHSVENHGVENHDGGYPHSHSTPSGNATTIARCTQLKGTQVMITFTSSNAIAYHADFCCHTQGRGGHVNKWLGERFVTATNSRSSSHCRRTKWMRVTMNKVMFFRVNRPCVNKVHIFEVVDSLRRLSTAVARIRTWELPIELCHNNSLAIGSLRD